MAPPGSQVTKELLEPQLSYTGHKQLLSIPPIEGNFSFLCIFSSLKLSSNYHPCLETNIKDF